MKEKGRLSSWNDTKGFGFITPEGGGKPVFAHISAYAGRGRPAATRRVVYQVDRDRQGRLRAGQFRYVGVASVGARLSPGVWFAGTVALAFLGALAGLFRLGYFPLFVPAAYSVLSLVLFFMYLLDKRAAGHGGQRIPENRLHLLELLGGWPGALVAQQAFRHKTRKLSYQFVFWLAVILNLGGMGWLLISPEAEGMRQAGGIVGPRLVWSALF